MDKLVTTDLGGFPFVLDDIRQFLGRLTSPANHGIYQAFNNLLRGFGDNFIVQGVVLSGSTGAFSITEGWILLSGELIKVDAQGPFDEATDSTFVKVTTFDSRGNKSFLNGSVADTYEQNRAVVSGSGGTLDFDGERITFRSIADHLDDSSVATIVNIKTKIIELGDWDMDFDTNFNVEHGFAAGFELEKKLRSINIMIRSDDESSHFPLNKVPTGGVAGGSVSNINNTKIFLTREPGGIFDNTSYDATSFNRGWATITYQDS